jgi:uncharacterized membrane protein YqhA
MSFEKLKILRKLLGDSKWIAYLAVLVLYTSSGMLVMIGLIKLFEIIYNLYLSLYNPFQINTIILAANFFVIIEIYLLAIVFFIFAVGLYNLFIGELVLLKWLKFEDIDDLKLHIAKTIVLFLSVLMVQKIAEWEDPKGLLFFTIATSLTAGVLIWYIIVLRNNIPNNNHSTKKMNNQI